MSWFPTSPGVCSAKSNLPMVFTYVTQITIYYIISRQDGLKMAGKNSNPNK